MQSVDVKSQPRAPGDRQVAARDQRLHFHGQRPLPVHGHNHRRPAEARVARAQKIGCGVLNDFQPLPDHLKDQQFLIRPETVLQHAQEPEHLAPIAFQRNDRIDHVLKQPRPGERAVLRDMAHKTTVVVPRLQASTISVATARTWLTLPGRPSALSDVNVCTESTISRSGAPSPSSNGSTSSTRDVDSASKLSCSIPRRLARSLICGNDSSPLAYRTSLPEAATAPAICNRSVDLPMPGSPP